jgi:hypothetical protein
MQNVKRTARETLEAMLDSGELSNTAWGLVSQNADDTMAEAARGLIEREPFEYMSETYCEIVLAHIAEYGNPTEIADPAAAVEVGQQYRAANGVPLTVTRIDRHADGSIARVIVRNDNDGFVGHQGDFLEQLASGEIVIVESVKPVTSTTAESLAVLQAVVREQDRRASVTLAGARILRRFVTDARAAELNGGTLIFGGRGEAPAVRKLERDGLLERVRESIAYRLTDAGRVWLINNSAAYRLANPAPAAEAQYVTVTDEQGVIWHLTDADGQPVAAGEYTAEDGDRFTIAKHPEAYFGLGVNEAPRTVDITWQTICGKPRSRRQSGVFGAYVDMIVDGWHWKRADA